MRRLKHRGKRHYARIIEVLPDDLQADWQTGRSQADRHCIGR
jgi:hypothetical protein